MKRILSAAAAVICLTLICACQKSEAPAPVPTQKRVKVVTTLFPLYDFARAIGGDKADVTLLLPPGVEAHNFEPKPEDVVRINTSDLFVFTNEYMEPWAVKFGKNAAEKPLTVVDASRGATFLPAGDGEGPEGGHEDHGKVGDEHQAEGRHHHYGGMDPHLWLDFANARIMVDNIAAGMALKDPANRDFYMKNAARYNDELKKLDEEFKAGLATCRKRVFLHGGHYAFGYLAHRYGLRYQSASAVNADAEPTPARLIDLVKQMKANGLQYVFSEELISPRSAEIISTESGASILMLHGAHNISRDDLARGATFISLMRKNLENLRIGLQCN
jgi:zinc transport system substrate-binding protein